MALKSGITVLIAHIPPRRTELSQALASVMDQTLLPTAIIVETDDDHLGAAVTKNRGLAMVQTEWTAMLDDDDEFLSGHLETLMFEAERTGADVLYPWFQWIGPTRCPLDGVFGRPFNVDMLRAGNYIPSTVLMRTELALEAGGFQCPNGTPYDDWGLWLAMLDAGAKFHHVPVRTWLWHKEGGNTDGLPVW